MWAGFHGLRQAPKNLLWPVGSPANSAVFSRPTTTAPALSRRAVAVAV